MTKDEEKAIRDRANEKAEKLLQKFEDYEETSISEKRDRLADEICKEIRDVYFELEETLDRLEFYMERSARWDMDDEYGDVAER